MIYINSETETVWLPVHDATAPSKYYVFDIDTLKEEYGGDLDFIDNTRWPNMIGLRGDIVDRLKELEPDRDWCLCLYEPPSKGGGGRPVSMCLVRVSRDGDGDEIIERA